MHAADPAPAAAGGVIRVRGAREHNLRDIDVDLPRDTLVVVTGVSGSGKSSLAFATIHAEAQRRYLESVAPYARRLIGQAVSPRVREITGLPPSVALHQRRSGASARSTVGTLTTISNSLRMLLARAGEYPPGVEPLDSDAFSPNTAAGACPTCLGMGRVHTVTEQSLVPDPALTIRERAIAAWPGAWQGKNYRDILDTLGYDIDRPWRELDAADREWILFTDEQPVVTVHPVREAHRTHRPYQGMYQSPRRYVLKTLAESRSATQRARAERHVVTVDCAECHGTRLRASSLAVTFAGQSIAQLGALALRDLAGVLRPVAAAGGDADAAAVLCRDLVARIDALDGLGLGYLATDRTTTTLSAGEHQRLRLATQLRSGLFGVVYVLDEPSAGLHPADAEPLLDLLDALVDGGNTLVVVAHDLAIARRAGWIVDVGPGAGEHGGAVVYAGPVAGIANEPRSTTGRYLSAPPDAARRERRTPTSMLRLHALSRHNLRGLDLALPRGVLTAITGVSGSGKSTLVQLLAERAHAGELEGIGRIVDVDQAPLGRSPRSNLATYTGLFDVLRKQFAATDAARERGYSAGRFSFNVQGGRCETCQGEGFVAVELLFLPGTYGPCPDCGGARYEPDTLEVRWRGHTIAQVLDLTVDAAADLCADLRPAMRSLRALRDVGLGYLHLGQPATELSGGEAQRIKLASELQRAARGHCLYLLDEPTTGLHPADVEVLVVQLQRLVDADNTVVVVEHDMAVAACSDHVIDLGPGAGDDGGRVVAVGTPEQVAAHEGSRTAGFLRDVLGA